MLNRMLSRGQKSSLHLQMLNALGCGLDTPADSESAVDQALCEAIALHSNETEFCLFELFGLAAAMLQYRSLHCETSAAIYDVKNLAHLDRTMVVLAIKLCGAYFDPDCNDWRDGDGATTRMVFPQSVLSEFLFEWADSISIQVNRCGSKLECTK